MGVCYIVGGGECKSLDFERKEDDWVIAADAGYKYLQKAKIKPDIVIGDFDSLKDIPYGENIIKLNPIKDITDMEAAVKEGIKAGFTEFHLYGACGGRVDHTLANFQLVASIAQKGLKAFIHDEKTVITSISDSSIFFDSTFNGYISVFSHSDKCSGVYLMGLKYTLENAELTNSFPLGVSNEFIGEESCITVKNGTLIIVYSVKNLDNSFAME